MDKRAPTFKKAFTLIEIVVVMIIIGISAAIAVPMYFNMINRSHAAEASVMIKNIADNVDGCLLTAQTSCNCLNQYLGTVTPTNSNIYFKINNTMCSVDPTIPTFLIWAQETDSAGNPITSTTPSYVDITCNGTGDIPGNITDTRLYICRGPDGTRTLWGFGDFQGIF